jgi:sugar fermentation stimulation protein A
VIISRAENPKRKYAWTLEMVQHDSTWIGVNTARSNTLVAEALADGTIDDFGVIRRIIPEIRISAKTRLDFLLESDRGNVFLEVKNCSLVENGIALFPDAVTARGTKHLLELIRLTEAGNRGALLFCVQRGDAISCSPAGHIDSIYAQTLAQAVEKGVICLAFRAEVTPSHIVLTEKIPFVPYSFEATVTP